MDNYYKVALVGSDNPDGAVWVQRDNSNVMYTPDQSWISHSKSKLIFYHLCVVDNVHPSDVDTNYIVWNRLNSKIYKLLGYESKTDECLIHMVDEDKTDIVGRNDLFKILYSTSSLICGKSSYCKPMPNNSVLLYVQCHNAAKTFPLYISKNLNYVSVFKKDLGVDPTPYMPYDKVMLVNVCNLGVKLRDEQLNGSTKTPEEVVDEFIREKLK